eukprot:TRINITY_DN15461_c0_g1_i1.p1 TRINITY_DN15461_c0_g1~~TRINITY_DN15461_c0_g1_i1.p1  ORF type:complete len:803 (-),score=252.96 TRINITY_DN15461_c0_g1_i1:71-2479(-)
MSAEELERKEILIEDKAEALEKVKEDGMNLRHVSPALRADREVVMAAVGQCGMSMLYADPQFASDREVVMIAVNKHGLSLEFASDELREDHEVALAAVEEAGLALAYLNDDMRNDEELVFAAVQSAGMALCSASEAWQNDRDCVLQAVQQDPLAMEYASDSLCGDKDIVKSAVDQAPITLKYASDVLKDDYEIAMPALREDGLVLEYTSLRMRDDVDAVLAAVSSAGLALEFATEKVQNDKEVVDTAVTQNGLALQFASARLRGTEDICYSACRQAPMALEFCNKQWQNDKELVEICVNVDGFALRHADDLKDDYDMALLAVRQNGRALVEASHRLRNNFDLVKAAVEQDGTSLLFASPELRQDREIVQAALAQKGVSVAHVSDQMIVDHELLFTAFAQDGMSLLYCTKEDRANHEVVVAACHQNGLALKYASFELRLDVECGLIATGQNREAIQFVANDLQRDAVFMNFAMPETIDFQSVLASKPSMTRRKWAISMCRRTLEPFFKKRGLPWAEAVPLLRAAIDESGLRYVQGAYEHPEQFTETLEKNPGIVGRLWTMMQSKPAVEPELTKREVLWKDFGRVLKELPQIKDIRACAQDPVKFLDNLDKKTAGRPAIVYTVCQMRLGVQPFLPETVTFDDIWHCLEEIGNDSLRELRAFSEAPKLLVHKLNKEKRWKAGQSYSSVALKPEIMPSLDEGIQWTDFHKVLALLDPFAELHDAVQDQKQFFKKLRFEVEWPPTRYWVIAQLRPIMEEKLVKQGGLWEEVVPILEQYDVAFDLQPALRDPEPILARLAEAKPLPES